ncbi:OMPdecase domain containing protein [Asbolus verrucosus]|uniref:Orotidine 5'-phosphate decarboxylase n=1 Tax=Asbolus verrucosus TaxID=1661398 RepID=A0A482V8P0_ASBVE|nr:OMPdecase domain containing protein [Asbolus verrucosus]
MHAILSLTQLMEYLKEENCIDESIVNKVKIYLNNTQVDANIFTKSKESNRLKLSFMERARFAKNKVAERIFQIMATKNTTLCVAADLTKTTDILNLAEEVGPHICLFKTHIDIVEDFHPNFLKHLQDIAQTHNFILFEDKKFADIGKTVQLQYSESIYKISSWASLVTAHSLTGKGVLDAIRESEGLKERGVFLLAETSAASSLIDGNYTQATVKLALQYTDLISGIVCQSPLFVDQPGLIQLTPGVQLDSIGDTLSQQYNTPEHVVLERGADIAVVGRGITKSADPALAAQKYKELLWNAYKKRIV